MKYKEVGPSYKFTDITNNFTNVFGIFTRARRSDYKVPSLV